MKSNIKLGDEVQCVISGFKGIANGYTKSYNGSIGFFVQPKMKKTDDKYPQSYTIDAESLKVTKKQVQKEPTEPEEKTTLKMGDTVKTLAGITGVIFKRHVYWNRCVYFELEYKSKEGKLRLITCSSAELIIVKKGTKLTKKKTDGPAGPVTMTAVPK